MIDTGLQGKVALVTGANHGIGASTARALAVQGAAVFLSYLRLHRHPVDGSDPSTGGQARYFAAQAQSADEVIERIRHAGGRAAALEIDLSDPANVPVLFDRAEAAFGPVDVLVNNAAHSDSSTFVPQERLTAESRAAGGYRLRSITAEIHDEHFAVNARAVALMMAEYARRHVADGRRWGRIINISTDAASCFPGEIAYGASKYALESYSHSAACELGAFGITVNIVAPGPTQTGYITPEAEARLVKQIPLGRLGQPEDIADVVVFLASEQGRWLTGQKLYAGGGKKMPL
ncbi:MAG: SDR family oxidoreductase [Chloroflexi bacterium]|nr:SDR family oxidoreductase [Chloroflexota bacterium]